jgi:hypothetical protein
MLKLCRRGNLGLFSFTTKGTDAYDRDPGVADWATRMGRGEAVKYGMGTSEELK